MFENLLIPKSEFITVTYGSINSKTQFIDPVRIHHIDILISLQHIKELQIITLENEIIIFDNYYHECLAPKGSVAYFIEHIDPYENKKNRISILFKKGLECKEYIESRKIIDDLITNNLKNHSWEQVTLFRPR